MPTYLCHGFRWHRRSIRVYVVVQNLDDASPEWIIPAKSSQCFLESFYNLFEFLPYHVPPSRSSGGWSSRAPPSAGGSDDDNNSISNTAAYNTNSRTGRSRSRSQHSAGTRSRTQQRSRSQSQSQAQSRSRTRRPSNSQPPPPPLPGTEDVNEISTIGVSNNGRREDDITSQDWSVVKLVEEYDPMNLDEVSRPHAYVADYVVRVDLSVSIADEIQRYEERLRSGGVDGRDNPAMAPGQPSDEANRKKSSSTSKKQGWLEKLRDQLQRGEDIRWYVVVNGDEVRDWPDEPPLPERRRPEVRPTPSLAQRQHHAQYTLQQEIFKENDRHHDRSSPKADPRRLRAAAKPAVPEKDLPALRTKASLSDGGSKGRPKTPSKAGGFRRLFGRGQSNKAGDEYHMS
ncbi:hypothetical protein B0H66DRAFT_236454 [Apodospora peruviana]|uniref:Developmental regulator n=1 Tax=Apodospora peruviana TaxID=516989 RepID=A0AAE0M408_9PEZI|nr:hypothetical protein B0H66DRAFT_236454 [Apodospora peruviana]